MNKEIEKQATELLSEIHIRCGFQAYQDLNDIFFKMKMRIEDLEKSRDLWKKKYTTLSLQKAKKKGFSKDLAKSFWNETQTAEEAKR